MKAIVILLFVLCPFYCRGNEIDKLKTINDVKAFLKSKASNKKIDFFGQSKLDALTPFSKIKFLKIDLNHDGLTDLIVNGSYLFAVIDDGKGDFSFHFIDGGAFTLRKYILVNVDTTNAIVIVNQHSKFGGPEIDSQANDTLVFRYGGFVEFNKHPEQFGISGIAISTTECFGTCPVFDLSVDEKGVSHYFAKQYNKKTGKYISDVNMEIVKNLFELVNYIKVRSLKDNYSVNWTDDQTIKLTVTYKDGSEKYITDYGKIGTFGLRTLYDAFYKIRGAQKWKSN